MGLSRTAKILLAALLVAAAGFAWVNFFNQDQFTETPQPAISTPSVAAPSVPAALLGQSGDAAQPDTADATDGATVETQVAGDSADVEVPTADGASEPVAVDASDETSAVATDVPTGAVAAPPVVVTQTPSVVTRDLVVGELPFLVTAPPVAQVASVDDTTASANRPVATQRTSVNPFSPILVQSPAVAPGAVFAEQTDAIDIVTDAGQPSQAAVITDVPVNTSGSTASSSTSTTAVAPPPAAPAPRTVAPATSASGALPRPLPSGTLPVTPEILREARAPQQVAETPAAPVDLGTLAAIRVPDEPEAQDPFPTTETETDETQVAVTTPDVLGTDRPNEPAAVATETPATVTPTPSLPLAVGGDPLSRYLRDNNVRFTGSVLGPLSVGVFRSARFSEPVVLTLGQPLPDTDIILSDLRGYEARFSMGDTTQTLSLDLRR